MAEGRGRLRVLNKKVKHSNRTVENFQRKTILKMKRF